MNALAAARALAGGWPAAATIAPETGRSTCIETVRHVVEAFKRAGCKEVRPLAVELLALNPAGAAQILSGKPVPGAQKVLYTPTRKSNGSGWPGHLVVDHDEFLLDLVLPGALSAVGATGFDDVPAFVGAKGDELIAAGDAWVAMSEDGATFRWTPMPKVASYRNTAAWRGELHESIVDWIAERIKESSK